MLGVAAASADGPVANKAGGGLLKQALHAAHDGEVIAPKKPGGVSMFGPAVGKSAGGGGPSDELAAKLAKRRGES